MKVADFGLARSLLDDNKSDEGTKPPVMTDYVATRWYRAPEILLGSNRYGKAVDLWSLGCIFGEMLGGKPVVPGTSTLNQLEKIGEMVGAPTTEDITALASTFTLEMLDAMPFPMGEKGPDGNRAPARARAFQQGVASRARPRRWQRLEVAVPEGVGRRHRPDGEGNEIRPQPADQSKGWAHPSLLQPVP